MKHFPPKSAEALLELVVRRHQNRSTYSPPTGPSKNGPIARGCAGRHRHSGSLPPAGRNHSHHRRSYRLRQAQPVTATAETKAAEPRRNQPTSRIKNDEFFALCLGLQRHPKKQKDRTRFDPSPGRIQSLQSKDGPVLGCTPAEPYPPGRACSSPQSLIIVRNNHVGTLN